MKNLKKSLLMSVFFLCGSLHFAVSANAESCPSSALKHKDGKCVPKCTTTTGWDGSACTPCESPPSGPDGLCHDAPDKPNPMLSCSSPAFKRVNGNCIPKCTTTTGWNGFACTPCANPPSGFDGLCHDAPSKPEICTPAFKLVDGKCTPKCSSTTGWNGSACVPCANPPAGLNGVCHDIPTKAAPLTSCASSAFEVVDGKCAPKCKTTTGWNGSTCVPCPNPPAGLDGLCH
ncbi:MAG: hypothetical protein ABIQ95_08360 [Bdellovibrionia bacterium]